MRDISYDDVIIVRCEKLFADVVLIGVTFFGYYVGIMSISKIVKTCDDDIEAALTIHLRSVNDSIAFFHRSGA